MVPINRHFVHKIHFQGFLCQNWKKYWKNFFAKTHSDSCKIVQMRKNVMGLSNGAPNERNNNEISEDFLQRPLN